MTHTPGPWRVGDAGMTIFGPPNGKPSPQRIADLAPRDERKANAALLAAAPELLEACKALYALGSGASASAQIAVGKFAEAAIRKAEGHDGR